MQARMVRRGTVAVVTAVLVLAGARGTFAQGDPPENPARSQAFVFERALRSAVELGGQQLANRALVLVPELTLTTDDAIVRGLRLSGYGFYFDVQAPSIQSTVLLLDMAAARQRRGVQSVSASGGVASDGIGATPAAFDPDREYTSYVRSALVDAMLDSSGVLSVAQGERLTVVVSGIEQPNPNPLYRSNSSKLILTISAEDLVAFRQGRLTREQAKERIVAERF